MKNSSRTNKNSKIKQGSSKSASNFSAKANTGGVPGPKRKKNTLKPAAVITKSKAQLKTEPNVLIKQKDDPHSPGNSNVSKKIANKLFPIVAIGASAGGLEAYSTMLNNVPGDTGMAFVVIQHLDPTHKSLLKDILSREIQMNVVNIENGLKPEPDTVYVMPQNIIVKIENGIFRTAPRPVNDRNMPIDIFMRSLAEDNTHYAIGVILSGTDSDGVLGLEFIKTSGGITFAQDKKTAKFHDMPRNAISAGAVDFILPPPSIARELIWISKNPYLQITRHNTPEELIPDGDSDITTIYNIMHSHNGIDFRDYKPTTVKRRILRRMVMHKISHIKEYVRFLKKNHLEIDNLCEDILINVTSFFRDPATYEAIKSKILPQIFEKKDRNTPVRIWITACSTGEEAYSMAIIVMEYLENIRTRVPIQIFSTDLSDSGIEKARAGVYSEDIRNDVSKERLKKFFIKYDGKYQINKPIRDMCVFAKQNLIQDPPFSKIDLISCRNVLIYLGQVLQNKLMPVFHYAAAPGGFLVLGTSETVGSFTNLFEVVDKKNKIFKKRNLPAKFDLDFTKVKPYAPAAITTARHQLKKNPLKTLFHSEDFKKRADSIILSKYSPASVIVNSDLEILQFRGKTSEYLDLPQGEPTFNLLRIAREELAIEIRRLIKKISKDDSAVSKENIEISRNGQIKKVNLIINPINNISRGSGRLYLIIFEQIPVRENEYIPAHYKEGNVKESKKLLLLKNELAVSKDNLQSIIEQLESANEELRSANEEIQSSNEELQSTNEELETAKEELQSTNEELTTVNDELQNRNNELSVVNNDLTNLLGSINIPIVMLDNDMRIRRYTLVAERLMNFISTDIGRKITTIHSNVEIPDFEKLVAEVIETPTVKDVKVKDKDNCWYSMRIRPYMTPDNKIDGVIIVFIDITDLQKSLMEIEKANIQIEGLNVTLESRVKDRVKEIKEANLSLEAEIKDRKGAEESLRLLSKHLVSAQETERQRLSRELHDGVNQLLSIVKRKITSAELVLSGKVSKSYMKDIGEARKMLDNAIAEVKKVSRNLRPSALDELGLESAVVSMVEEFRTTTGINTKLKVRNVGKRLLPEMELHVYRIIQESLHNVQKHSKAKQVSISIEKKGQTLFIKVNDDGRGFSVNGKNGGKNNGKFGLLGMKERAESLGGTFEVISLKGKGSEINVMLPAL